MRSPVVCGMNSVAIERRWILVTQRCPAVPACGIGGNEGQWGC
jgi:hypothetical protein